MPSDPRPEVTDPEAYIAAIIAKIGSRDPLDVIAETPAALAERVAPHSVETLRARPAEGMWSPLEILGHLVDAEFVFGFRGRTIFCDDRPLLVGIEQGDWVARQRHHDADPQVLLDEFAALRRVNLRFWRSLTPDDMARVGRHQERGDEPLGRLRSLLAGHDVWHLEQFDRYIAAARA